MVLPLPVGFLADIFLLALLDLRLFLYSFGNFLLPRTKFDGAWSKDGCTLVQETDEHTTCQCNYLTNFAVLMEARETEVGKSRLYLVSFRYGQPSLADLQQNSSV